MLQSKRITGLQNCLRESIKAKLKKSELSWHYVEGHQNLSAGSPDNGADITIHAIEIVLELIIVESSDAVAHPLIHTPRPVSLAQ